MNGMNTKSTDTWTGRPPYTTSVALIKGFLGATITSKAAQRLWATTTPGLSIHLGILFASPALGAHGAPMVVTT
jgi:hypothetical protein